MKRSIIQLGGKTYVVSLPIKWIEKLNLKKKDEIEVIERGDELVISPKKSPGNERIEVMIDNKNKKLVRNLFLILGSLRYDEVVVKFDNPNILPYIHEIAHEYSGFTLIEQTDDKCFFKIVSKEIKEEFDYYLNKTFKVTLSLANNFTENLKSEKYDTLKTLVQLEKTNNQLTTLCQRILIKSGYKEQEKTCFVYILVWNLEIIADFYRRACDFIANESTKKKIKLSPKTIEIVGMANVLLKKLFELSEETTVDKFIEIFDKKEKIGFESEEIFQNGRYEDIILGHYFMDIVTYIQDCAIVYLGISSDNKKESKDKH